MGQIDDLNDNRAELRDLMLRVKRLETATPMNSSSIGAGGIRVHSGGVITIENGGLRVTGSAEIIGELVASGTITMSGTFTQTGPSTFTGDTSLNGPTHISGDTDVTGDLSTNGPLTVNGATDINGNLDVDGTLDINGATTLNNDLTVNSGGKIKAGVTQLNPDGTLSMGAGKRITPDNGTGAFAVESGAASMQLTPGNADYHAQFSGGGYFQGLIRGMGLKLMGLPVTSEPANLYIDASGNVMRSTA
jgi:cytoskeletal protein CcmA (bactofilin family)